MNIYNFNETNFDTNGLGFLTDMMSASVTNVLNGELSLSFEYPVGGKLYEQIKDEAIIKCNIGDNNYQLFRIKYIQKTTETINVYAMHIFYDLLDNFLLDTYPTDKNAQQFLEWILANTQYSNSFTATSSIIETASARYIRKNPVEAIMSDDDNSLLNLFNAEIERNNFEIAIKSQIGESNNVKLILGKNIQSIDITNDMTSVYTRIMPIAYGGLTLPEDFVDSPLIGNYITPKITTINYDDIVVDTVGGTTAYATEEEAYTEMRNRVNALYSDGMVDSPSINVKINWVELSKVQEYVDKYNFLETVRLGDTLLVELLGIDYETRCIKTIYNVLLDEVSSFEIGTVKPTLATSIQSSIEALTEQVEAVDPTNILSEAKAEATTLINSAMGGYVYKTQNELYIMDNEDPEQAVNIWRWNINGLGFSSSGIDGTYGLAFTHDGKIVADRITAGQINLGMIAGLQDIIDGFQTNISLNTNDIQFNVTQVTDILENGVSKIKNTLVEINELGIEVSKSNEEMKSLLDNKGFKVTRDTETVLEANNDGVIAENLTARKFFIIGESSRMEDYDNNVDDKGTGMFYVGGE